MFQYPDPAWNFQSSILSPIVPFPEENITSSPGWCCTGKLSIILLWLIVCLSSEGRWGKKKKQNKKKTKVGFLSKNTHFVHSLWHQQALFAQNMNILKAGTEKKDIFLIPFPVHCGCWRCSLFVIGLGAVTFKKIYSLEAHLCWIIMLAVILR